MEFSSAGWQTILKFNNTVYGRSLIFTSHVWACKVCCLCYFELLEQRSKNISKILSRSWDHSNPTIAMLLQMTSNQRKLVNEHCGSVWWQTEWFCRSFSIFVMSFAGILIDFYYKELIEIGAKPAFSIWYRANMWRILAS